MNASNYYLRSNDSSATWVDINASLLSHTSSLRAPIFYDSNNTGYYVDPASTSALFDLTLIGASNKYLYINPGNGYEAMVRYNGGSGSGWYVGKRTANQVVSTADFHFYSEAAGATVAGIDTSGNVLASGSFRAPIFYDSNNTGYYLDPASTSNLWVANLLNGKWFPANNVSGESIDIYVRPDNNNTYVWRHIYGGTGTGYGTGVGGYGIYCQHLGGDYSAIYSPSGFVTFPYSARSPIFYDSNNTAYYGDFATTSRMNALSLDTVAVTSGITGLTSAPITTQYANAGTTNTWYPMTYQRAQHSGGYVTHLNTGLYKNVSAWGSGSSGWYAAVGGNDSYPTQAWYLTYDAYIQNSLGYVLTGGSFRAPIFYDLDDTGYYIDPNSTSNAALRMRGGALFGPNTTWGQYLSVGTNGNASTSYASVATTDGNLHLDAKSGSSMYLNYYAGNNVYFCNGANTIIGQVSSAGNAVFSGNVTAYGSPSDRRLKENIQPIKDALATVLRLSGCTFDWKEDTDEFKMVGLRADTGFIADEVRDVIPSFVREDENGYLSLRDRGFAALLVEAIKELSAKVDALR
jgi:hypothetical protein